MERPFAPKLLTLRSHQPAINCLAPANVPAGSIPHGGEAPAQHPGQDRNGPVGDQRIRQPNLTKNIQLRGREVHMQIDQARALG